jgi:hypothetical protein
MIMKKQLLLLVLMMLPLVGSAEAVEIDGICYNLISKGNIAEVTGSNYHSGDVVIPETVTYNDVTYSVTTIRKNAFTGCSLNSIEIPSSITKICQEAFYNGGASSVKIKDLAAWCNINFESYFKTNPLSTASHLFLNDEEIHDLVIPDGVNTITDHAFYYFSGLTSVKIPSSVTSIGYECFAYCLGIKTVEIGDNASQEAATVLGGRAFYKCDNLNSVILGNNIVEIGRNAFDGCKSLQSIVIPNSVKTMGSHAFLGCESLESVQLSENLKSIEWASFSSCDSLKSITIPDGVEFLGESAFGYCKNLSEVKLPSNLKKIDWCVFQYCTSLTSIDIPDNTHTIYRLAFIGCTNLKTVTLGKSMKDIYGGAFAECPALEEIYCKAKTPPTCYTENISSYAKTMDVFYDSYVEHVTLHVPAKSIETYKATEPWSKLKTFIPIIIPEHTLTYMVDGEVYKTYSIEEGEVITQEPEPVREGFVFSGWSEIPETMPAHDVTVTGTFVAVPKCATPTIKYEKGQLSFTCDTEGAEFVTEIADSDIKRHYDANIQLTATYTISVYATKAGYDNSDVATATLCWIDVDPKTEGIENSIAQVRANPVLIQSNNGQITITGAEVGTSVFAYSVSGHMVASTHSNGAKTTLFTDLRRGEVAIIKIGDKSIKIVIQ